MRPSKGGTLLAFMRKNIIFMAPDFGPPNQNFKKYYRQPHLMMDKELTHFFYRRQKIRAIKNGGRDRRNMHATALSTVIKYHSISAERNAP